MEQGTGRLDTLRHPQVSAVWKEEGKVFLREERQWHSAAAVEGVRVMLLGGVGGDSPLTGEIAGDTEQL